MELQCERRDDIASARWVMRYLKMIIFDRLQSTLSNHCRQDNACRVVSWLNPEVDGNIKLKLASAAHFSSMHSAQSRCEGVGSTPLFSVFVSIKEVNAYLSLRISSEPQACHIVLYQLKRI